MKVIVTNGLTAKGSLRHKVGAIHCTLLLVVVLFFVPVPSFADGCTTSTYVEGEYPPPASTQWIVTTASCTSMDAAYQACASFAGEYGATCGNPGNNGVGMLYQAGWYRASPSSNYQFGTFYFPQFFVSVYPPTQCDICVGDPINPANGAVFLSDSDAADQFSNSLPFKRFYNSTRSTNGDLSTGWRHSFSRSVAPMYSNILYKTHQKYDPNYSTLYDDEATACTSGFAQIKGRFSSWVNAASNYANGQCNVIVEGAIVGTVRIYSTLTAPFGGSAITGIDATRDDGELISFTDNGSSIVAPPGVNMTLTQTASGYTLTDGNDNVELYDTDGRLISVTSRTGVVHAMSYDTNGRLDGVTDSFGHQLTLVYDIQNRLISITRK